MYSVLQLYLYLSTITIKYLNESSSRIMECIIIHDANQHTFCCPLSIIKLLYKLIIIIYYYRYIIIFVILFGEVIYRRIKRTEGDMYLKIITLKICNNSIYYMSYNY